MLTAKQERFCQNLEIKKMSQRQAYLDAYPKAQTWKPKTVDETACKLVNENPKIITRLKELRDEVKEDIKQEAKWSREDAHQNLTWLIEKAKEEIERGEMSGPCVSAIINSTKELNTIFGVGEKAEGGVLGDILAAVRGINND
jgi:hypothetical protein